MHLSIIFRGWYHPPTSPPPAALLPALSHVKCINTAAHHRHVGPARSSAQQRRFWCALLLRGTDEKMFKTTRTVSKSLNRSKQTTAALTLLIARSVSGSELALPLGPRGEPSHRRCGPRLFQHEAPNSCAVRFWKLVLQNDWSQVVPFVKRSRKYLQEDRNMCWITTVSCCLAL